MSMALVTRSKITCIVINRFSGAIQSVPYLTDIPGLTELTVS